MSKAMTQEELSAASGTHPTYISDIERGARNPSWEALVKLAKGMDATMTDIGEAFERLSATTDGGGSVAER